jgi:hypothetical protein
VIKLTESGRVLLDNSLGSGDQINVCRSAALRQNPQRPALDCQLQLTIADLVTDAHDTHHPISLEAIGGLPSTGVTSFYYLNSRARWGGGFFVNDGLRYVQAEDVRYDGTTSPFAVIRDPRE